MKPQPKDFLEMNKINLYGAGGHGKVVKDVIESTGAKVDVFFDEKPIEMPPHDIPVLHTDNLTEGNNQCFIISIGDNRLRKEVSEKIKSTFISAIHKYAKVSKTAMIGEGTVVMAGSIINPDTKVGKHVIINTASVIEHDCRIEDFSHISPNATITGNVNIREGAHVGAGAIILPNITVGKWSVVGAGAVITKDVPDYAVVVGNPGKIIKYNNL